MSTQTTWKDRDTLKLWRWTLLIPITLIIFATQARSETSLDQYLALRRQYQATSLSATQAAVNPATYHGRVIEIRGIVAGAARNSTGASSVILNCAEGSYIISSSKIPEVGSGAQVCALAVIGDGCTSSLSDLRLLALTYESRVADRERQAQAAESAKRIREASARQQLLNEQQRRQQSQKQARRSYQYKTGEPMNVTQLVTIYKNAIKTFNPRLSTADADTIARSILGFSSQYKVDPRLVVAVILAESHFKPNATSGKGAMGLGQLMPGTAAGLGVNNAYDPVDNVKGSVRLIRGHLDRLAGHSDWSDLTWHDLSLALASYNAGPGAVRKYGGVPPYRETQAYVKRVIYYYKKLCGIK